MSTTAVAVSAGARLAANVRETAVAARENEPAAAFCRDLGEVVAPGIIAGAVVTGLSSLVSGCTVSLVFSFAMAMRTGQSFWSEAALLHERLSLLDYCAPAMLSMALGTLVGGYCSAIGLGAVDGPHAGPRRAPARAGGRSRTDPE